MARTTFKVPSSADPNPIENNIFSPSCFVKMIGCPILKGCGIVEEKNVKDYRLQNMNQLDA